MCSPKSANAGTITLLLVEALRESPSPYLMTFFYLHTSAAMSLGANLLVMSTAPILHRLVPRLSSTELKSARLKARPSAPK